MQKPLVIHLQVKVEKALDFNHFVVSFKQLSRLMKVCENDSVMITSFISSQNITKSFV